MNHTLHSLIFILTRWLKSKVILMDIKMIPMKPLGPILTISIQLMELPKQIGQLDNLELLDLSWNRQTDAELAPLYFWRGAARCLRGERRGGLRDLRKAVERDPELLEEARTEEDYAILRSDPRGREVFGA